MRAAGVPLGEVAELRSGVGFPTRYQGRADGDFPFAKVGDISSLARRGVRELATAKHYVNADELGDLKAKPFPPGTVAFAKIGEAIRQNFRAVASVPLLFDNNVMGAIPTERIDPAYLFHFLASIDLYRLSQSTTVPSLRKSELARIPIPLPPIGEQRRIAAMLDAADALRGKRRQALAKLDTLTEAIFVDMFASTGWDAWESQSIESLAAPTKGAIRTGPFGSELLHDEFTDEGIAVLGIDNAVQNKFAWGQRRYITEEKYAKLARFTVLPGDVLVTIMGTCGRVAIVPDDIPTAINTKHLCCITVDNTRCLPEWLWACLRFHPEVLRQLGSTHGAVMPGLNMGKIKQAKIPLPPLALQERFAEKKAMVEVHLEAAQGASAQLDALFASLQQRAFRGEL